MYLLLLPHSYHTLSHTHIINPILIDILHPFRNTYSIVPHLQVIWIFFPFYQQKCFPCYCWRAGRCTCASGRDSASPRTSTTFGKRQFNLLMQKHLYNRPLLLLLLSITVEIMLEIFRFAYEEFANYVISSVQEHFFLFQRLFCMALSNSNYGPSRLTQNHSKWKLEPLDASEILLCSLQHISN